jgi:hypothetical protein
VSKANHTQQTSLLKRERKKEKEREKERERERKRKRKRKRKIKRKRERERERKKEREKEKERERERKRDILGWLPQYRKGYFAFGQQNKDLQTESSLQSVTVGTWPPIGPVGVALAASCATRFFLPERRCCRWKRSSADSDEKSSRWPKNGGWGRFYETVSAEIYGPKKPF